MLYLPPEHFHYVEALEVSISANVWSYSKEATIMEDVMQITRAMLNPITSRGGHFLSKQFKAFASAYVITRTVTMLFGAELNFVATPGMCTTHRDQRICSCVDEEIASWMCFRLCTCIIDKDCNFACIYVC